MIQLLRFWWIFFSVYLSDLDENHHSDDQRESQNNDEALRNLKFISNLIFLKFQTEKLPVESFDELHNSFRILVHQDYKPQRCRDQFIFWPLDPWNLATLFSYLREDKPIHEEGRDIICMLSGHKQIWRYTHSILVKEERTKMIYQVSSAFITFHTTNQMPKSLLKIFEIKDS